MPQLVRIANDVDRGDPISVDGHAQRMIELAVEIGTDAPLIMADLTRFS